MSGSSDLMGITAPAQRQGSRCKLKLKGGEEEEVNILSKAYEVLMVGVNVGQFNVNQQQNLGGRKS